MATQIKANHVKRVGHVNFHSKLSHDDKKGLFVVSGKHNGVQVVGTGPTERQAALDFHKQLEDAQSKLITRG